jgi:O-antigen/teichoic acid export membrane protein
MAIGRMLGAASLGLYMRAYSISMLPLTEVSDVFSRVTFPVFVKIAHDKQRLLRAYAKSLVVISALAIGMGGVFYFFPEAIITIILGKQWIGSASALQVLAIFGAVRAISMSSISPLYALKRQDMVTHITLVSFLGLAVTIVPFVMRWGIVGGAYSALFGSFITIPLIIFYLIKVFKV